MKFKALTEEQQKWYDTAMAMQRPELPEKPECGTWYKVSLPGCICSCGKPYYGYLKIGTENNLMVLFEGGGVAVDTYTAARPNGILYEGTQNFYFDDVDITSYGATDNGIGGCAAENPFSDWSVLCVSYASGDFHTGTGDGSFVDGDGDVIEAHFHGYTHFRELMDITKKWIPNPESLLVTGYSAGGFAASILADDVISYYPECGNITCCVDSAILLYDWHKPAVELWKSPAHIADRLKTRDFSYDGLKALYEKYGSTVKYLYLTSTRDCLLTQYQNYIDTGTLEFTKESGIQFQNYLKEIHQKFCYDIPEMIFYFFAEPDKNIPSELELTEHTLIANDHALHRRVDGVTVAEWIMNAVNGKTKNIGLALLDGE